MNNAKDIDMNELTRAHLHLVVSRIPADVREMMIAHSLLLAGGFIRSTICGEKPNDIDLFCAQDADVEKIMMELSIKRSGRLFKTENAITVLSPPRSPVQLIKRWRYNTPGDLIHDFDFTIAQACVWPEMDPSGGHMWRSITAESYYPDLASKMLIYTSPKREEAVGGSTMRLRKFLRAGYQVTAPSFAAVMACVFTNVRNSPLTDTEEGCAKVLCGLLREVDPLIVVDGVDLVEGE